ncbi:hypothetical protein FOCG_08396 [Fusarium oxysporum f. sp. radicis-lycopersici 26381]|uniref:Uncharacterized protein n=1 Tax=Fusarium oxysporum Fo47 TaxID=660027 RepID=W9JGX7_FUSOX|nr:hypothetical protein FOZG_15690 [Fusarium oxysporum Fo47]EWZ80907.1 hypothetical protein FOWG_15236 [Fusarium oxysporum f. sp. lycopersici MN25]EXL52605.1 hypothetical protein FOCG_08396 [Fusarium oxysporum f. sp. radicis-lycopersici 26381]
MGQLGLGTETEILEMVSDWLMDMVLDDLAGRYVIDLERQQ